jgi:hypothetical protein
MSYPRFLEDRFVEEFSKISAEDKLAWVGYGGALLGITRTSLFDSITEKIPASRLFTCSVRYVWKIQFLMDRGFKKESVHDELERESRGLYIGLKKDQEGYLPETRSYKVSRMFADKLLKMAIRIWLWVPTALSDLTKEINNEAHWTHSRIGHVRWRSEC